MDIALLSLALLPPIIYMVLIWKKDSAEREPLRLVGRVFALGAASTILALILEVAIDVPISLLGDGLLYIFISNFIGVGLMEEISKLLAARTVWKNKEFNYVFDGIVYCAAASLGFAAAENVLYVMDGGMSLAFYRALLSIPAHTVFGVFMGGFYGLARLEKERGNKAGVRKNIAIGLALSSAIHGAYDFLLSIDSESALLVFLAFVVILDIVTVVFIFKHSGKHDVKIFDKPAPAPAGVPGAAAGAAAAGAAAAGAAAGVVVTTNAPRAAVASYCTECGCAIPVMPDGMTCKFCPNCGHPVL